MTGKALHSRSPSEVVSERIVLDLLVRARFRAQIRSCSFRAKAPDRGSWTRGADVHEYDRIRAPT